MKRSIASSAWLLSAVAGWCSPSGASTTTYQYDELGRVSSVSYAAATVRYVYDKADNRTQKQTLADPVTTISISGTTAVERGGSVVLNVSVGGSSTSGTVSFYDGSAFIGSAPVINGVATVEVVGLVRGSHAISASYSGDTNNNTNSVTFPIRVVNLDWLPAVLEILMD